MANRASLEREIKEYCDLNGIRDVPGFITQCMLRGFNIFKYGTSPGDNIKRQNGEIVDNGSNRKRAEKPKADESEAESQNVIVRKKRTIKVTKVSGSVGNQ